MSIKPKLTEIEKVEFFGGLDRKGRQESWVFTAYSLKWEKAGKHAKPFGTHTQKQKDGVPFGVTQRGIFHDTMKEVAAAKARAEQKAKESKAMSV